jgi:hypothetical protein
MSFNKLSAFTQKVADAADQLTGNPAGTKAIFDAAPEELREYFNNLIDALKSTSDTDSAAKNLGAKAISGIDGTDVQTILENIVKRQSTSGTITYFNGFSQFNSAVNPCWVSKDSSGMVSFYLLIVGNGTGTIANNTCANLPAGFRPSKQQMLQGYVDTPANFIFTVNSDGNVMFVRNFTSTSSSWLLMTGTFPAGN